MIRRLSPSAILSAAFVVARLAWPVAAAAQAAAESALSPWPGASLLVVSSWQAELNLPVAGGGPAGPASPSPGAGLRASFGVEGLKPLVGLGAAAILSYRWLGDGADDVLPRAGAALELSYRVPVGGALSLRPLLECGASYGFGPDSPAWGLDLAAGMGATIRLGAHEYLSVTPSLRLSPLAGGLPSFALAAGARIERAWRLPIPEAGPRLHGVPALYSPDGDGRDDEFKIRLRYRNAGAVVDWSLVIRDAGGSEFARRQGSGRPPADFSWDGLSDDGRLVDPAADYSLTLTLRDALGRRAEARERFTVDILVMKVGERYKVRVPPIVFPSNSADLGAVSAERMILANKETLERLIALFSRFPEYRIVVEGHANAVRWADPKAFETEQRDELIPLSRSRAEAVQAALVALGIAPSRIRSVGLGGSEPLAPFSDAAESWRNRRVEFLLVKAN